MPVLMSTADMQELAIRLAKMRLWRAKWTTWGMDKAARYDMWRVAIGTDEYHTRITLPNRGIRVTLVERREQRGSPNEKGLVRVCYKYVEARVEPIPAPARQSEPQEYLRFT